MKASETSLLGEFTLLNTIFTANSGCCLEVGAFDGVTGSSTLVFERRGWKTILVEPLPELVQKIKQTRSGLIVSAAAGPSNGEIIIQRALQDPAISGVSCGPFQSALRKLRGVTLEDVTVPQLTLDKILADSGIEQIDFATIDVEGFEAEVLAGFDLSRWTPRVVILEDNSRGADLRVRRIMESRGYRLFCCKGVNDWYARITDKELVTLRAIVGVASLDEWRRIRRQIKRFLPSFIKRGWRHLGGGNR